MDMIKMVSILGAALAVSFGAIGPALGIIAMLPLRRGGPLLR